MTTVEEVADSSKVFKDTVFMAKNKHISEQWVSIKELYPDGVNQPLLPDTFSRKQFGQGNHYECFMQSALSALVNFSDVIRNCFITKKVRRDGRYTFQFFRGREWVKVEIDDMIALEDDEVLYLQSPTEHWWPLLLEKAYAKFYTGYDNLEGCTLQEAFHDLTGNPVLNLPTIAKLAITTGVNIENPQYWLTIGDYLRHGEYVASTLTKDKDLEALGMQSGQQYAILSVFTMSGTPTASSLNEIVVQLHNPFEDEEFVYTGPLNPQDNAWDAKTKAKHDVDNPQSIFMPLSQFIKVTSSIQLCLMSLVENDATYFSSAWRGPSAGGNPTMVTWRNNPLYLVRNTGSANIRLVLVIKQEDQRRFIGPEEPAKYIQCGVVVSRATFANPTPTFYVTGNNHKPIFKSLFLNSREVANTVSVPPDSLCYIVPSAMNKGTEADFSLALYRMKGDDYSDMTVEKLEVPGIDWANPPRADVQLSERGKDRIDFYVDEPTDIHILLHQLKPFVNKTGGDAMMENYMGMYLYDDTDRRIGGVHAATNFREISVIQSLPRSGRYAISVTCPRAKSEVPAYITMAGMDSANVRIVTTPEDAHMFDDEDVIDEGDDDDVNANATQIDYFPISLPTSTVKEMPDSNTPYEDKRFFTDNRNATDSPWVHIGDLYPEGKAQPLLPLTLSRDQFEQGEHFECCCLAAFAALVDNHPDVIRKCFVTKAPRKDGRYTFQFHRYGQWHKIEIDDRIPQVDSKTLFCRSPTKHWWPLLLEKAFAKFYTLYQNLEGCTQQELFHDLTGRPVLEVPMDAKLAQAVNLAHPLDTPEFWRELAGTKGEKVLTAAASGGKAEAYGLPDHQCYAVLDIIPTKPAGECALADVLVKLYNPFEEATYTGPMNSADAKWPVALRKQLKPDADKHVFFVPATTFPSVFSSLAQGLLTAPLEPSWNFNSEWSERGTNGGNPSLITWRENPLYLVRNTSREPVQIVAMVRQPDQRHVQHTLPEERTHYPQVGLTLAMANPRSRGIPTYLVTLDNHQLTHKGLFECKREVANLVTVPPRSLSYLVGSCMLQDKSKFMLSYWCATKEDADDVKVIRLRPDVARDKPAVAEIALQNRGKDRVDFLVDCPTNVHILLRQKKPFASPYGGDTVAEDFVGMYLYDSSDKLTKGVTAAMSYREISLVHALPAAGRYAVAVTCPRGSGNVPCLVEIVAVDAAHVRLTHAPAGASELSGVDLAFLDTKPEGIDLAQLPLDTDDEFQRLLAELRQLLLDPNADPEEICRLQDALNARAHELAKGVIGSERPIYLPNRDLKTLNPVLDAHEEYMAAETERYLLKQDPRKKEKVAQQEEKLRTLADAIAEEYEDNHNLDFLDPEPEGIALADLYLNSDEAFTSLMVERARLRKNPDENANAIAAIERALTARTHELAKAMHAEERGYLNSEPEGIPLHLLPLDSDDEFRHMEERLRALNKATNPDQARIRALEDKLNDRAAELARELKRSERAMFLNPSLDGNASADGVPPAVLDADEVFHAAEIQRLELRQEDAAANAAAIRAFEDTMNERAHILAQEQRESDRAFLRQYGLDPIAMATLLDSDSEFTKMEKCLRALNQDPAKNAKAVKALQAEMAEEARRLAEEQRKAGRPEYMHQDYRGRPYETLPLDADKTFLKREDAYLQLRDDPAADAGRLAVLLDAVHARADELAQAMTVAERAAYLPDSVNGISTDQLALSEDAAFCALEEQRAAALAAGEDTSAIEDALRARAEELAQARLASDRAFLDAKPEGIPLALVDVDSDAKFGKLERKRAALRANGGNQPASAKTVVDLEHSMNERAHELARQLKADAIEACVDPTVRGVPREQLGLPADEPAVSLIAERAAALAAGDEAKAADAGERLNARAHKLAADRVAGLRVLLDQAPLQVPLSELPLDDDATFHKLEQEAARLQSNSNGAVTPAVQSVLDQMNSRATELAEEKLWAEREEYLDSEPAGRLLRDLPLNDDDEFMALEKRRRTLAAKSARSPAEEEALERLTAQMNERTQDIAQELNRAERRSYLGNVVQGVAVDSLPLDKDETFTAMEERRARLARDPKRNAAALRELEEEMRRHAEALAADQLKGDRAFLDQRPEGVPLRQVPLDEDAAFCQLEQHRAALKNDPARNAAAIAKLEEQMNSRAKDLAADKKRQLRAELEQTPLGVPLQSLPLDTDKTFTDLEEKYRDAEAAQDTAAQQRLLDALNARAEELAEVLHAKERQRLDQFPHGIPLNALPLNEDEKFLALENEARDIRKRNKNDPRLASLEDQMNERAEELADEARKGYCEEAPEGIPLELLNLGANEDFTKKEAELRYRSGAGNATRSLGGAHDDELNELARAAARQLISGDRDKYVDENPEGVPLSCLPLDTDPEFHAMEVERARLQAENPVLNRRKIEDLEGKLNDRAHELALAQKAEDLEGLDPLPGGLPIAALNPHDDPVFADMVSELRDLKKANINPQAIKALQAKMNARCEELAHAVLADDRGYLDPNPEGVPLRVLPLDTDPVFHAKEVERAKLKLADPRRNAGKIKMLEDELNDRAAEVARAQLAEDLRGVDDAPNGIPKECLGLHEDTVSALLIDQLREAKRQRDEAAVAALEQRLRARSEELARQQLDNDLEGLEQAPLGVPLSLLQPHSDAEFAALVPELRRLKKDPVRNAPKIKAQHDRMDGRDAELAGEFLDKDRAAYLDAEPEGLSWRNLNLCANPKFKQLENKKLGLQAAVAEEARRNPKTTSTSKKAQEAAQQIQALETELNDLVHALAAERVKGDRGYLDPCPEGVALEFLPLDDDGAFRALEMQRAAAKAKGGMGATESLEDSLNERAHELARAQKVKDLEGLNQAPRGVPLAMLHPHSDSKFAAHADQLRRLKQQNAPKEEIKAVQAEMNAVADQLAAAVLRNDRGYLDPRPAHVPLARLPLDKDATFVDLESKRAALKYGPDAANNREKIAAVENALNSRAHELAKKVKAEDFEGLHAAPRDLPLDVVDPHKDEKFSAMTEERARLSSAERAATNQPVVASLNKRALELADAMLQGDRDYLHKDPEGVSLALLPLDTDPEFHAKETERATLKAQDPKNNATAIRDTEAKLNDRAIELARMHLGADRSYLDPKPEGVPLSELPLDTDPKFRAMEVERARVKACDTPVNNARAADLEAQLNQRAHELAKRQLADDLGGLDREPAGYLLKYLKPHTDSEFAALVGPLREAKKAGNTAKVHDLQKRLNARAEEIARARIVGDRAFMNPSPEGVLVERLPLDTDPIFRATEKDLRSWKATADEKGIELSSDTPEASAVRGVQDRMDARAHELAMETLRQNRGFLDPEPEGIPIAQLPLDTDAAFRTLEVERLRLLGNPEKLAEVAQLEAQLNDRVHELARSVKNQNRNFLNPTSFGVPRELLKLDDDKAFLKGEAELWRVLAEECASSRTAGKNNAATAAAVSKRIKNELQARADAVGERQVRGDRDKYLSELPVKTRVEIADLDLDHDKPFTELEVERAILVAQDPAGNKASIRRVEDALEARAEELARQLILADRAFLPEKVLGIPMYDLPLDDDDKFKRLEHVRRGHRRAGMPAVTLADDKAALLKRAEELAAEVIADDLAAMQPTYRNVPVSDLGLHSDDKFRELAARRRRCRGQGRTNPTEITAIEDEMDRRACEIADDVIDNERGFLDQEPEGMYLADVPLDSDPVFTRMETEHRRRARDPRVASQNKEVLRELQAEMNQRSHALARAEFAKLRDFMIPEPEGIPLAEIGLDEDPEFKECEIARYRSKRNEEPNGELIADMERRMDRRAVELARAMLAADRGFLDLEPEGVPLELLPLDSDTIFCDLAKKRRRSKKGLRQGAGEEDVRTYEDKMNARCHELAKDFLNKERAFLDREPEGVPLADVPIGSDGPFRMMERSRLELRQQLGVPLGTIGATSHHPQLAAIESDLNDRAHVVAADLLRRERAFLDPEPFGVTLDELPLNRDTVLNPVERRRRALRREPKLHQEAIRDCEDQMIEHVNALAEAFVKAERGFMDQEPEGVPLRYLPLSTDREFREMELRRRKLRHKPEANQGEILKLEEKMNTRVHALATDLIKKGRAFLDSEPLGVPIADVPLNGDEAFRMMEEQRRRLKDDTSGRDNSEAVRQLEAQLNNRALDLAKQLLDEERAFMNPVPLGVGLDYLPLNDDRRMREIERTRRRLRKSENPDRYTADVKILENGMEERALELARKALVDGRCFLDPEPCGVPLDDLPLETDPSFHSMELEHFRAVRLGKNPAAVQDLKSRLYQRAYELAEDFIRRERAYLDQNPEGVPLSQLPLDKDVAFHSMELERRHLVKRNGSLDHVRNLEDCLNRRVHELALEIRGWQDVDFHEANKHVAEEWPRVRKLYPEGREMPLMPSAPLGSDVDSAAEDAGYLAPFLAALGRHPVLLERLIATTEHPIHGPYSFVFFDPNSNPVYVDIDDRVPCDADLLSKFTLSLERMWYPLLVEKAYAKFVGGYENLDNCTPHETLRDLTGRPVTHIPFDRKLAEAANIGDYTSVNFWLGVAEDMARGDVILGLSNGQGELDGIHPQCSYALLGIVETVEGTVNPADIVIKLHNAYRSFGTVYNGPLCHNDTNWTEDLRRVCKYNADCDDVLYLPLPTFLRNFSSLQNCHINCGDRLTATGAWEKHTAGGNPKFTTFRNNSMFLVENKSTRPVVVLAELRHNAPTFVDPEGANHYPQTGLVLMQPTNPSAPPTPLITNSVCKFLQRGMMLDSREVCSVMELPANSVCSIVPYTMRSGEYGAYSLSVYPGMARVTLTPLHYAGLSREPTVTKLTLSPGEVGKRVDFTVTSACDVHVLLHQDKVSDSHTMVKGDTIAEDDVVMTAFTAQATRIASSGDATNAREHSLSFKATQPGRYSLLLTSPNQPVSGDCPVTLSVYTPKKATVKFVPAPIGARPLQQTRFPTLPKSTLNTPKMQHRTFPATASSATSRPMLASSDPLPPLKERGRAQQTGGRHIRASH